MDLFADLPESQFKTATERVAFGELERVPICAKYRYPNRGDIKFVLPPPVAPVVAAFHADLVKVFNSDPEHYLCLTPTRWHNVHRDLAEGWMYMPWLCLDKNFGGMRIMDGTHRVVALLKQSITTCPIVCNVLEFPALLAECGVEWAKAGLAMEQDLFDSGSM